MNVFEDLIVELKEANLLESTVIEDSHLDDFDDISEAIKEAEVSVETAADKKASQPKGPVTGQEFFRKKAVGEVSSLQMVEHVITGVEREYLKVVPKSFDDLRAKGALHNFLNAGDPGSQKAAEVALVQETEAWCSALALRDSEVPVAALRNYCERSRPALSSQALLALGRFYRNLPHSEQVRSKFDFIITRLFSRSVGAEKRVLLFSRDEMLGHIATLYSDWSSVSLYDVDGDSSKVSLTALSLDELADEAEEASSLDLLIESDFFGRFRMFKESISELFYAPKVAAAAISANIRVGNAYVEFIDRERQKLDPQSVRHKYAEFDAAVSDTTGKTLQLEDLLKQLEARPAAGASEESAPGKPEPSLPRKYPKPKSENAPKAEKTAGSAKAVGRLTFSLLGMNRWLVIVALSLVAASAGVYVWANYVVEDKVSTAGVKVFDVESTPLTEYIKAARISGETFYAQVQPGWNGLSKEKRQEVLQKILAVAKQNGCRQVDLLGSDGKPAAYASANRLDVNMP